MEEYDWKPKDQEHKCFGAYGLVYKIRDITLDKIVKVGKTIYTLSIIIENNNNPNLEFEILDYADSQEELDEKEKNYIDKFIEPLQKLSNSKTNIKQNIEIDLELALLKIKNKNSSAKNSNKFKISQSRKFLKGRKL